MVEKIIFKFMSIVQTISLQDDWIAEIGFIRNEQCAAHVFSYLFTYLLTHLFEFIYVMT